MKGDFNIVKLMREDGGSVSKKEILVFSKYVKIWDDFR